MTHTSGDASSFAGYGAPVGSGRHTTVRFSFSPEEMAESSTWKEVNVIEKMYLYKEDF